MKMVFGAFQKLLYATYSPLSIVPFGDAVVLTFE